MDIRRVAIVFSGGPAPAANAVISAAAIPFLESGRDVIGIFHGYTHLASYRSDTPLMPNKHYRKLERRDLFGVRNQPGVMIGTARVHPGMGIDSPEDLDNETKTLQLNNVYRALRSLNVDALVSIGGDGTLMTANFLHEYQKRLPDDQKRIRIIHLPKTIDNDYHGIDFAFGFFTAVDVIAKNLLNLRADAHATSCYFVAQTMGRQAGWLAYGAATAGEADLVVGVEDLHRFEDEEGQLSSTAVAEAMVDIVQKREKNGDHFGVFVVAEGLAEKLPKANMKDAPRDHHGHLRLGQISVAGHFADACAKLYEDRTGQTKRFKSAKFGYEARSVAPHAFDVMLGSQLGVGAYRALVEEELDAHMVSVQGQLELTYLPFHRLVDPTSLKVEVRMIPRDSDYRNLVRFLEQYTGTAREWDLAGKGKRSNESDDR